MTICDPTGRLGPEPRGTCGNYMAFDVGIYKNYCITCDWDEVTKLWEEYKKKHRTIIKDCLGTEVKLGDIVMYKVLRCSPNMGSWCQVVNKHHGHFKIHGKIVYEKGSFCIRGDEIEIAELRKRRGREQADQIVLGDVANVSESFVEQVNDGHIIHEPMSRYAVAKGN